MTRYENNKKWVKQVIIIANKLSSVLTSYHHCYKVKKKSNLTIACNLKITI